MTLYSQIPQISSLNCNARGPNIPLSILGTLGAEGKETRPCLRLPRTPVLSGQIFSFSSHLLPFLFSETGSHLFQVVLALDIYPTMILSLWPFCLHYPSPGITFTCHHTQVMWCQDPVHVRQASYLIYTATPDWRFSVKSSDRQRGPELMAEINPFPTSCFWSGCFITAKKS